MNSRQVETSPALWAAVWQLADAWSETPVVQEFASELPRHHQLDAADDADGVSNLLKELGVRAGSLMHTPLMYGTRIPMILRDPFLAGTVPSQIEQAALTQWLHSADYVESAFRRTLGWLRSSLSGYPVLRAPQLSPGTPLTTFEITNQFIWTKDELRSGLNQLPSPPNVAEALGADRPTGIALKDAAQEVSENLRKSPAWIKFQGAAEELDHDAKIALRAARHELTRRLSAEHVDAHEESLALPRSEYRAHTTAEVLETLSGLARTYADAFGNVQALLGLTMCEVFGELAFYGEPALIQSTNLNTPEPGRPIVEFQPNPAAAFLISPGQVAWLDNEAVIDAVRIESISHKISLVHGDNAEVTASVLLGTGEAWPRPQGTLGE